MSFQTKLDEKKEFFREVIIKAVKDSSYKRRLIENPIEAIREVFPGFTVGGNKKIVATDQTDNDTYYLNVSQLSYLLFGGDLEELELSEEELEMVAGGVAANPTLGSCNFLSFIGFADEALS